MELALFDFDNTVTDCDTYARFLRRVATPEQLAHAWWKVGPWLLAYRLKLISAERIRARVTRLVMRDRHGDDIAAQAAASASAMTCHVTCASMRMVTARKTARCWRSRMSAGIAVDC